MNNEAFIVETEFKGMQKIFKNLGIPNDSWMH
jgi:hypothetical protein